jgi:uridine nucleosidase
LGIYLNRHRDLFGDYGDKVFQNLLGSVGLNAMFGLMRTRIDNGGHLGGFLGGVIVAWTVGPNLVVVGENERVDHRVEETRTVARRRVVNRPLLQTYTGEFMEEFRR